ncbi:MAG: hypothetical protein ACI8RZ_004637, partial [Myxococcota bacterium]
MRLFIAFTSILTLACGGLASQEAELPAVPSQTPSVPPPPAVAPAVAPEPLPSAPVTGRPEWAGTGSCGMPQLMDTDAALREADASSAIRDGVLLCEVDFSGTPPKGRRWDAFGGNPDPSVTINDYSAACAGNTHNVTLSWQGVSLETG